MLIMDGSSNNAVSLARWYKGEHLAMDEILTGAVRTYSAESAITDSPIGMITDILAFDEAVKEAVEFAKKNKNTMVIAVTDHGNSGITIGSENTTSTYDKIHISNYIDPLKKATMTVEGALSQLKSDRSNLVEVANSCIICKDKNTSEPIIVHSYFFDV